MDYNLYWLHNNIGHFSFNLSVQLNFQTKFYLYFNYGRIPWQVSINIQPCFYGAKQIMGKRFEYIIISHSKTNNSFKWTWKCVACHPHIYKIHMKLNKCLIILHRRFRYQIVIKSIQLILLSRMVQQNVATF